LDSTEIARRILRRDQSTLRDGTSDVDVALQRSFLRFADALRESLGEVGSAALFARALARTEVAHPALKDLRRLGDHGIRLDDIAASVEGHGIEDVAAGIEALIVAVVDVLTRLIGEDMTIRLLDYDEPDPRTRDGERAR
jgi:hypothetical protein